MIAQNVRSSLTYISMSRLSVLKQEDFDKLLAWLHHDRLQAGQKYETIRESLIKIFSWRGYDDAEDLADEVVNRVAAKMRWLVENYVGDPALYFYGVAKKILLELERREQPLPLDPKMKAPDTAIQPDEAEATACREECLQKCLRELDADDRMLILAYYQKSKQAKIDYRKELARQFGLGTNALRVKVFRIRANLKKCIQQCLQNEPTG
jgi:RNA polymerase sigma factor (sigma-70 family)